MPTSMLRGRGRAPLLVWLLLAGLACDDSPTTPADAQILTEPADQSVVEGTSATFTVTASDAASYTWQSSSTIGAAFVDVAGATSAAYTTPATVLADDGARFRVIVAGADNSVTSAVATLSVSAASIAPAITAHPAAQVVVEGADATFTVTATGTSLTYQWQRSTDGGGTFGDVASATSATLTRTAVPIGDDGHLFRVVVGNVLGSVTSNAALLTVGPAPVMPGFSVHPSDQDVLAPATATFTVTATGVPAPTLQWQVSTGAGFSDIPGATLASYTTPATSGADDGNLYRAVASNASGSATSNDATLTVTVPAAPVFTQQPQDVVVVEGQDAQLTVAVTGVPAPGLQWQVSTDGGTVWGDVAAATGTALDILDVTLGDDGRMYRALADNGVGGPVSSDNATLSVTPAPPPLSIVTDAALPGGVTNALYSVTLVASGGVPPYTWSDPFGSLQAPWAIDPLTGEISGTSAAETSFSWTLRVRDSSNPQQTAEKTFSLNIEAPCDVGMGSATVAGAPNTVGGRFCPGTVTPPGAGGIVFASWTELYTYGSGSYYEIVTVHFDAVTGDLQSVAFVLNDPTRSIMYLCIPVGTVDYPQCTGVDVDVAAQSVHFEDTLVGSGSSPGYTLNGELRY